MLKGMKWYEIARMSKEKVRELAGIQSENKKDDKQEKKEEVVEEDKDKAQEENKKDESRKEKLKKEQRNNSYYNGYYQYVQPTVMEEKINEVEEEKLEDNEEDIENSEEENTFLAKVKKYLEERKEKRQEVIRTFREEYIARHSAEPSKFQMFIAGRPILSKVVRKVFPSSMKGQNEPTCVINTPSYREKMVAFKESMSERDNVINFEERRATIQSKTQEVPISGIESQERAE